jgi:hypothetical protein
VAPLSEVANARLFAVLAGGVVKTACAELPNDREGRFCPFCLGAVVFGVALTVARDSTIEGPIVVPCDEPS